MTAPYERADKTIELMNRLIVQYFKIVKDRLIAANFDELNVMREITAVYSQIDTVVRRNLKKQWCDDYIEWCYALVGVKPDGTNVDKTVDLKLLAILDSPNETTKYAYATEILRKQQRTIESVIAVDGSVNKQVELDKAMKPLSQMIGWYTDLVAYDALVTSFADSNVKRVEWVSENDSRVCHECKDLHGQVFNIDDVPAKPHPGCRCWLIPAD